ncbi:kinesin, putative [Entamoeba histolytica HM-1:IMSS-B]|uniref:Kinesin-like protein n=6 Tax=Entamoeba histolytica TaxID=5759 RepID=C4M471_ENTH1|nr:kinesin, putative [Entamoeba histolytica HM-1:IMSS]EMD48296.1 bipolar kinesin, putative [Entamoeba histolytica KU27]EMH77294.1 kinesin, putative [Entamoeba histolytica HM-1:IMSS-B]EMS16886.1 bipolar kinesin, putative [Entamoeba histolytica HM-3:IMSS]ENY64407.1 kinesin, putative [Entamoeba histolytica HM-1:IMSS-A]GAT96151.1 kinesin putative [Entamoeba histolytica]|eukprot:XP_656748.1 kinesin, putative [Entamoeba histolytica HM-1:IMSS]
MNSSVSVAIRIRPQNEREVNDVCIKAENDKTLVYFSEELKGESFNFDYVADQKTSQKDVFTQIGIPLVETALNGYNSTLFAYGQTGSGKTFTTFGNCDVEEEQGIIPRSLKYLFEKVNAQMDTGSGIIYSMTCSMQEIYNEQVIDLIDKNKIKTELSMVAVSGDDDKRKRKNDLSNEQIVITSWEEAWEIIQKGFTLRHTSATLSNDRSSRSHCIFTVFISKLENGIGKKVESTSKLTFVDLAGSERQSNTGAKGKLLKEAANINRSLVVFGRVIHGLVQASTGKSDVFIPYRDSRLTFMLKDSLGGNCKTVIIGTVSPSLSSIKETSSTIKFCFSSRNIQCIIKRNAVYTGTPDEMKEEIERLRLENEQLKRGNGIIIGADKLEKAKSQIRHLEYTVFAKMDQERILRDEKRDLEEKLKKKDDIVTRWLQNEETFKKTVDALQKQILGLRKGNSKIVSDAMKTEIEKWKKLAQNNAKIETLQLENDELKDKIEKLQPTEDKTEELNRIIMEKTDEITIISKQLREVTETKEELIKERDALKLDATRYVEKEFKQKINDLETEIIEYKTALSDREKIIEDLHLEIDNLYKDNEQFVIYIDELKKALDKYSRKSIRELKEEVCGKEEQPK